MKTLACLRSEIRQIFFCRLFFVSCLIVALLELTAGFHMINMEDQISVLETVRVVPRALMENDIRLSAESAFFAGIGSWLTLFAPIIVSLPFCALYRDEISTGYKRFRIVAMGKMRYCIVKIISNFLMGALTLTIGTLIYGMMVSILFPHAGSYSQAQIHQLIQDIGGHTIIYWIMRQLLVLFFYGGFWGSVVMGFCGFIHNKYLIVGIPFMLKYIWREITFKQGVDGRIGPDSLLQLCHRYENAPRISVEVYLAVWGICIILFCIAMNRREDLGV